MARAGFEPGSPHIEIQHPKPLGHPASLSHTCVDHIRSFNTFGALTVVSPQGNNSSVPWLG